MDTMTVKNQRTRKAETIVQHDLQITDWGFHFLVDTEAEAYRSAYEYRHNKHGVRVEFAGGAGRWMVTVFNEFAVRAGIAS